MVVLSPYRVAVVGLGIGRAHLRAFECLPDDFTIAAICDPDAGRLAAAGQRFPDARAVTHLDDLLGDDELDIIDLCTPPALHLGQIRAALTARHHVVCEKPVVASVADVDTLLVMERTAGRRVMPIFQYRFGHGLEKLRRLVDEGVTGPLYTATVEVSWRRRSEYYAAPWRGTQAGELGGVLFSHAVHALDMLTYIAGPVHRVNARTSTRVNDVETEDCAAATIELPGGALATLSATLGSVAEITRHRFCFANLSAESGVEPYTNSSDPWAFTPDSPSVARRIDEALAGYEPEPEHFAGQFIRFAWALRADVDPPVTLADTRAAIAAVEAMYRSAEWRREVEVEPADGGAMSGGETP